MIAKICEKITLKWKHNVGQKLLPAVSRLTVKITLPRSPDLVHCPSSHAAKSQWFSLHPSLPAHGCDPRSSALSPGTRQHGQHPHYVSPAAAPVPIVRGTLSILSPLASLSLLPFLTSGHCASVTPRAGARGSGAWLSDATQPGWWLMLELFN